MNLSNLSVRKKIGALIFVIAFSVIALSFFFASQIQTIEGKLVVFSETTVPSVILVKNTEIELGILRKDEFSLLTNVDHPEFQSWVKGLEDTEKKIDQYLDEYEKGLWDQRDHNAFNKVKDAWIRYRAFNNNYAQLLLNDNIDEANRILLNGFSTFNELSQAIRGLVELNQTYISEDINGAHIVVANAIKYSIAAIVGLLVLMLIAGMYLTKQICTPLNYVVEMASKIASGDLTYQLPRDQIGNDELGPVSYTHLTLPTTRYV